MLRLLPVAYLQVFPFGLQLEVDPEPAEKGLESLPVPPMSALLEGSVEHREAAMLAPGFPEVCFSLPNVALEVLFRTGMASKSCSWKIPSSHLTA